MADSSTARPDELRLRAALAERFADDLDRRCASQDHLDILVGYEAKDLVSPEDCPEMVPTRQVDMQLLLQVMSRTGAPLDCWFQASHHVDESSRLSRTNGAGAVDRTTELTRNVAAWLFFLKCEGCEDLATPPNERWRLDVLTMWASQISVNTGGLEVTRESVLEEENTFLRNGVLRPCLPTVPKWLTLLRTRFEVVTGGAAAAMLTHACGWGRSLAVAWLLRRPYTSANSPRHQAIGILGLVLMAVGVVPARTLLAQGTENDTSSLAMLDFAVGELRSSLQNAALAGAAQGAAPVAPLLPKVASAALEFATDVSIREVRQHVLSALDFAFTWTWQRRHPGVPPPQQQASTGWSVASV